MLSELVIAKSGLHKSLSALNFRLIDTGQYLAQFLIQNAKPTYGKHLQLPVINKFLFPNPVFPSISPLLLTVLRNSSTPQYSRLKTHSFYISDI